MQHFHLCQQVVLLLPPSFTLWAKNHQWALGVFYLNNMKLFHFRKTLFSIWCIAVDVGHFCNCLFPLATASKHRPNHPFFLDSMTQYPFLQNCKQHWNTAKHMHMNKILKMPTIQIISDLIKRLLPIVCESVTAKLLTVWPFKRMNNFSWL